MLRRTAALIFLAGLIIGCKSQGPKILSMTGSWRATSSGVTITLTLNENGKSITGSGTVQGSSSVAVDVTGMHEHPSVSLTLAAQGYAPMNFTGSFDGDNSVSGTLNGSGAVNEPATFLRQ